MKCILGIGNPGTRYQSTRHNIGFRLLDDFAVKYSLTFIPSNFDYYFANAEIEGNPFSILKPTTYVNNSGIAAHQCINYYKIVTQDLLIVVDDINLSFGEIRLRKSGGDGGHNGLNSIIYQLNTQDFPRLRFGIAGEFERGTLSEFVLSKFSIEENNNLKKLSDFSSNLIFSFIKGGYDLMLSEFSRIKNIENKENRASQTNENQE